MEVWKLSMQNLLSERKNCHSKPCPTCLATDWSKSGIRSNLTRKYYQCLAPYHYSSGKLHWKLLFARSYFTKDTDSRYSPIDEEGLAIVHDLQQCQLFIMGASNLILVVDHKPFVEIFSNWEKRSITNASLFSLKKKTLMYG